MGVICKTGCKRINILSHCWQLTRCIKKSMRGYKISFLLSAILIVAAFVAKTYDKKEFGKLKGAGSSWVLLFGGLILFIYGYFEYRKIKK